MGRSGTASGASLSTASAALAVGLTAAFGGFLAGGCVRVEVPEPEAWKGLAERAPRAVERVPVGGDRLGGGGGLSGVEGLIDRLGGLAGGGGGGGRDGGDSGRFGPLARAAELIAKDRFLGSEGGTLLTGRDAMVRPGEAAVIAAKLRGGRGLGGLAGHTLEFRLDGPVIGEAVTDAEGVAVIARRFDRPGDHLVRIAWKSGPADLSELSPAELLVCVRPAETRMLVVDLDGTVVADNMLVALLDGARPVVGAPEALQRLAAAGWSPVYLTARPDLINAKTRRWLDRSGLPRGPLFEGPVDSVFDPGLAKTGTLRTLRGKFAGITAGVGDSLSDAEAYAANGLTPLLIVRPRWDKPKKLRAQAEEIRSAPAGTQVVQTWEQVESALTRGERFDPERMLRKMER
jgi:phosphoglycolate phosphatase-like HAD superfamily hydrolase